MVIEATQLRLVGIAPSISQIVSRVAPIFSGISFPSRAVGPAIARAARGGGLRGPSAVPVASNAIRTVSQLGKTRAGLNLSNRDVISIGLVSGGAAITTVALTQPGPSGSSAIETISEGVKDLTPGFENVTKFVQENGALVALIGLGIVVIVLIK